VQHFADHGGLGLAGQHGGQTTVLAFHALDEDNRHGIDAGVKVPDRDHTPILALVLQLQLAQPLMLAGLSDVRHVAGYPPGKQIIAVPFCVISADI